MHIGKIRNTIINQDIVSAYTDINAMFTYFSRQKLYANYCCIYRVLYMHFTSMMIKFHDNLR